MAPKLELTDSRMMMSFDSTHSFPPTSFPNTNPSQTHYSHETPVPSVGAQHPRTPEIQHRPASAPWTCPPVHNTHSPRTPLARMAHSFPTMASSAPPDTTAHTPPTGRVSLSPIAQRPSSQHQMQTFAFPAYAAPPSETPSTGSAATAKPAAWQHSSAAEDAAPQSHSAKRRMSAPADIILPQLHGLTPTSATGNGSNKRSRKNSDGTEEVWSADVEEAFHAAITVVPKLGRRKMSINGKLCGRNELIADHIFKLTGKRRTRKQISSHIQVLKNTHKNDPDMMRALVDPIFEEDGKSDTPRTGAMPVRAHRLSNVSMSDVSMASPGLSPQPSPSTSATASSSLMPITPSYLSSARGSFESSSSSRPGTHSNGTALTSSSHMGSPTYVSGFSIWASGPVQTMPAHYYAKAAFPLPSLHTTIDVVFFEDLPMADVRYAPVKHMYDVLPCQFLHIESQLVLPPLRESAAILQGAQSMCASLFLCSVQELDLRCVTTVYWLGEAKSTTDVPVDLIETRANDEHPYQYTAPFMPQFWSYLLEGSRTADPATGLPTADKQADREEIYETIRGMSVVQKYVVAGPYSPHAAGQHAHQHTDEAHVALVVTWDFECIEGRELGMAKVSKLMTRRTSSTNAISPPMLPGAVPNAQPSPLHAPFALSSAAPGTSSQPSSSSRPTRRHKPDLSVSIPPLRMPGAAPANGAAPTFSLSAAPDGDAADIETEPAAAPPVTPLDQMMHTPLHPPEIQRTLQPTRRTMELWAPTPTECVHPNLPGYANWSQSNQNQQRENESGSSSSAGGMLDVPGARPKLKTAMSQLSALTRNAMALPTPTLGAFPSSAGAGPADSLMAPWSARHHLAGTPGPVAHRPDYFPRVEISQERTPSA